MYIARPTPILFTLSKPRVCQTYPARASPESLQQLSFCFGREKKKSHSNTEYFSKCFALSTNVSNSSEAFTESPNFSVLLINSHRVKEPAPDLLPCLSQEHGCVAAQLAFSSHPGCMPASSHCNYFSELGYLQSIDHLEGTAGLQC